MKERQALFDRTYQLEQEILTLQEDLKELTGEFVYNSDYNPEGLEKDLVKKIMQAAKSKVRQDNLKEKAEKLLEIDSLIDEFDNE